MNSNFYSTTILLLLISLGYVATDIYLPSFPALAAYFHASDNDVQMTLFSYLLSFSLTPLIFGPLSDHIGRKKVIFGGILISIAATASCLFSQSISWLIFSRFLQGIGTGAILISSRAMVADLFTGKALAKQMSFMTMLMPLILAIAPTIGGALQESFQWQSIFLFLTVYMMLLLIGVIFKSESLKRTNAMEISQIFSIYRIHLKNRLFLLFGINISLITIGFYSYLTISPFLFQEIIGLSPLEYGALSLYVGAVILITGYINLRLIQYFSLTQILYTGASLILFSGALLLFFHLINILTVWSVLIPSLIFFTSVPFCLANASSKSLSFIHANFGAASALLTSFQFIVGALTSLTFSLISDESAFSLSICFILVGTLSLINLTYACKFEKNLSVEVLT